MEHFPGTQESGLVERAREGLDPKAQLYRQIAEASVRLHTLAEPEQVLANAREIFQDLFGPAPALIVLRQHGEESRVPFGGDVQGWPFPQLEPILRKAIDSEHPVVEGHGAGRALGVRLGDGGPSAGALFVGVAEPERRHGGHYVDAIALFARHLGAALANAHQAQGAGLTSATSAGGPSEKPLSLREAKKQFERRLVEIRLRDARGNIAAAARSLDMDRGQLSRLLKKHGVDKTQFRATSSGIRKNPAGGS